MVVSETVQLDGLKAEHILRPESGADVAAALALAARIGQAVVPLGGGRAVGMGDPPERLDTVLLTERLDRVVEYRPADQVITVEAGCRLDALQQAISKQGQFVALDPYGGPGHTVGGVIAAGWSGPQRLAFGPTRDQVLGLTVAMPRAGLVRLGGRVIKNVSGYDMARLHIGAIGTLGVIVEATLRVRPLPRHVTTLTVTETSVDRAWRLAADALSTRPAPSGVIIEVTRGDLTVLARFAGSSGAVNEAVAKLGWEEAEPARWELAAQARSDCWARISVPPPDLPELVGILGHGWIAEPGTGIAYWLNARDPLVIGQARAAAETVGGSLVLLAAPHALKRAVGAWGSPPSSVEIMRRLRDSFDPDRTLSPGRFFV